MELEPQIDLENDSQSLPEDPLEPDPEIETADESDAGPYLQSEIEATPESNPDLEIASDYDPEDEPATSDSEPDSDDPEPNFYSDYAYDMEDDLDYILNSSFDDFSPCPFC